MSALQRLEEKIEQWKRDHEALKLQNRELKSQLENLSGSQNEHKTQVELLERELKEKDLEIEKIISQVEALLAQ